MAGARWELERTVAGSLPPELRGLVQSCYSLELWKHVNVAKELGPRKDRGGIF